MQLARTYGQSLAAQFEGLAWSCADERHLSGLGWLGRLGWSAGLSEHISDTPDMSVNVCTSEDHMMIEVLNEDKMRRRGI